MVELYVTALLFLIPVFIACVFARIYNVVFGFATYLLFSYFLLKCIQSVDIDLLVTLNAEEALHYYNGFIKRVFITPVITLVDLIPNQELKSFLYLDLVQYSLLAVTFVVLFIISILLRKRRLKKYRRR